MSEISESLGSITPKSKIEDMGGDSPHVPVLNTFSEGDFNNALKKAESKSAKLERQYVSGGASEQINKANSVDELKQMEGGLFHKYNFWKESEEKSQSDEYKQNARNMANGAKKELVNKFGESNFNRLEAAWLDKKASINEENERKAQQKLIEELGDVRDPAERLSMDDQKDVETYKETQEREEREAALNAYMENYNKRRAEMDAAEARIKGEDETLTIPEPPPTDLEEQPEPVPNGHELEEQPDIDPIVAAEEERIRKMMEGLEEQPEPVPNGHELEEQPDIDPIVAAEEERIRKMMEGLEEQPETPAEPEEPELIEIPDPQEEPTEPDENNPEAEENPEEEQNNKPRVWERLKNWVKKLGEGHEASEPKKKERKWMKSNFLTRILFRNDEDLNRALGFYEGITPDEARKIKERAESGDEMVAVEAAEELKAKVDKQTKWYEMTGNSAGTKIRAKERSLKKILFFKREN